MFFLGARSRLYNVCRRGELRFWARAFSYFLLKKACFLPLKYLELFLWGLPRQSALLLQACLLRFVFLRGEVSAALFALGAFCDFLAIARAIERRMALLGSAESDYSGAGFLFRRDFFLRLFGALLAFVWRAEREKKIAKIFCFS